MPEYRHDSFCGLYCGACDILAAHRQGLETGCPPRWSDLPSELMNLPVGKKAEIKCHGCKSDIVFAGCSKCFIRKCAQKKTGIETCLDCKSFPCWRFKAIGLSRRALRLETKLPHLKALKPNQETIRNNGLKSWMEEQERKWRCPHCGKRLTWYRNSCPDCGGHK